MVLRSITCLDCVPKYTHRLNQDVNSFVETIRETYYEISFHIFTNNI